MEQQRSSMISARSILWVCAGLVTATLAALVRPTNTIDARQAPNTQRTASADTVDIERMQAELAAARQDTNALRKLVGDMARTQAPPAAPDSLPATAPEVGDKSRQQTGTPTREEELAHIQAEFSAETSDPAWDPSGELQSKVGEVLHSGTVLRSIECRRSMCRMETSHKDLVTSNQFTTDLVLARLDRPFWSGPMAFDVRQPSQPGDGVVVVGYLGREALPSLETSHAQ